MPSVQDLLESGEHVERDLALGPDEVVVTNRRLLVFTPTGPGANYRHVERPNVDGVRLTVRSEVRHLTRGLVYLLLGLGTVAAGVAVETDGLLDGVTTGTGAASLGVGGTIDQVATWIALIDDAVVVFGVVVLVPAVYHAVAYYRSRRSVLSVSVAGGDDIDLPTARIGDPDETVERLRTALGLPSAGGGGRATVDKS